MREAILIPKIKFVKGFEGISFIFKLLRELKLIEELNLIG